MRGEPAPLVYIGYSWLDSSNEARLLYEALRARGETPWAVWDTGEGQNFPISHGRAIEDCDLLVVLLSPSSTKSKFVENEVLLAHEQGKRVVPVSLQEVDLSPELALVLSDCEVHRLDPCRGDMATQTDALACAIIERYTAENSLAEAQSAGVTHRGRPAETRTKSHPTRRDLAQAVDEPDDYPEDAADSPVSPRDDEVPRVQGGQKCTAPEVAPLEVDGMPGRVIDWHRDSRCLRQVELSAFHPKEVLPRQVNRLLAYAHLSDARSDIAADAAAELGTEVQAAHGRSSRPVSREADITVVAQAEGLEFKPSRQLLSLWEDWQRAEFRFKALPEYAGRACNGNVLFLVGGVPIADLPIAVLVRSAKTEAVFVEEFA